MSRNEDEERRRSYEEEHARAYWETIEAGEEAEREYQLEEDKRTAIDNMVDWFFEQFEDPQIQTPRDGEDQVFIYPWGGPYEAGDVLYGHFDREFEHSWIAEAVKRIERDRTTEWAPTSSGDYYEPPDDEEDTASELSATVRQFQSDILERLGELELAISALETRPTNLGHNRPPDDIGVPPYTDDDRLELEQTIAETREELTSDNPNAVAVAGLGQRLARIAAPIAKWLAKKADLAVDEVIKSGARAITWTSVLALIYGLRDDLLKLAEMLLSRF